MPPQRKYTLTWRNQTRAVLLTRGFVFIYPESFPIGITNKRINPAIWQICSIIGVFDVYCPCHHPDRRPLAINIGHFHELSAEVGHFSHFLYIRSSVYHSRRELLRRHIYALLEKEMGYLFQRNYSFTSFFLFTVESFLLIYAVIFPFHIFRSSFTRVKVPSWVKWCR